MKFLLLDDICERYDSVLIDDSVLMGDIDKIYPLNSNQKFEKCDLEYFIYFCKQATILAELLTQGQRIFTNVNSLYYYEKSRYKFERELEKRVPPDSIVFDFLSKAVEDHKLIYKILDSFIIRLDSQTHTKIKLMTEKADFNSTMNVFTLYCAAVERSLRNSSVSIVTKNFNFVKCKDFFDVEIPIFYTSSREMTYTYSQI